MAALKHEMLFDGVELGGNPIYVQDFVPEGSVYVGFDPAGFLSRSYGRRIKPMATVFMVGPLTYWSLKHGGRWPFLSNYTTGAREMRRERRQRDKTATRRT